MSNYPRDEFDAVEENSARHGVHRSSMEVRSRSLLPLMVVGVTALCIGLLAFFLVPKVTNTTTPPPAAQTSATVPATTVAPAPTTEAPAPTPTPEQTPTPTPTPAPEAVVDKSVAVSIFNATGISGLAARYAGIIMTDGWSVMQQSNWNGQAQGTSVIYYSGAAQKVNAEALSRLLNIPTLVDTAELGVPLAVVLGPGA